MPRLKPKKKTRDRQRRFPFDWCRCEPSDGTWVVTSGPRVTVEDLTDTVRLFTDFLTINRERLGDVVQWFGLSDSHAGGEFRNGPTPGLWGETLNRAGNNNAQT